MDILNYVLMASGGLFIIAMLLICLGLFLNPKSKQADNIEFEQFSSQSYSPSVRVPDEENNYNLEAESESDEQLSDDEAEQNEDIDMNESEDLEESQDSDNHEILGAKDEESEEKDDKSDSDKSKPDGVQIKITFIDKNKSVDVVVRDEILIGRNPRCDVVLNEPMVSSSHCIIFREKNKLMLEDNNSTNGTMLNGKPAKHIIEIKNNDVLTLGDQSIQVSFV